MSLKVYVTYEPDGSPPMSTKAERTLQILVSRLQNGADVGREVHAQSSGELSYPVEDYVLYWPDKRMWIFPKKQIGLCHLEAGARLEFRQRKRRLKLRFLDASSKLLVVDETRPVKDLVYDVCSQLHIGHPEELSLVVASDYAVQKHHPASNKKTLSMTRAGSGSPGDGRKHGTVRRDKSASSSSLKPGTEVVNKPISPSIRRKRPGSASSAKKIPTWTSSKVKKQISKKHQMRLDTPWLDPTKTLAEQEVTETDELILMYRFYYHLQLQRGSANVEMLYKQARATYLAGEILCSPNDMVRLSAILCQIAKGNYSKHKYGPEFIVGIGTLIAPPKCKVKSVAKQIMTQHAALEDVGVAEAKCWFVKLWSSLELFGMEFLSCTNMDTKEKGLIGVSKEKIVFIFKKKKKNAFWDMDKLSQWSHDSVKETVSLSFTYDKSSETLNLSLPEYSGILADCLQGHRSVADSIPVMMRTGSEYQFDGDMESAISDFATQTKRDAKQRRALSSLTFADIYWISKIENPLLSEEELAQLSSDDQSWENPVFGNMDQLMDERFSFLDFIEKSSPESGDSGAHDDSSNPATPTTTTTRGSPRSLSTHSPVLMQHSSPSREIRRRPDSSPLIISHRSSLDIAENPSFSSSSPTVPPNSRTSRGSRNSVDEVSPRKMLHNGIMDTYFPGHSRNSSEESLSSSKGSGLIGEDSGEEGKVPSNGMSQLTVR